MKIPRRQVDTIIFRARREFKARFSALEELSCADAAVKISAMVDGELAEGEVAVVRAHMRACPDCRRLEQELRRGSMMVRALLPVLPSAGLKAAIIAKGGLALGAAAGIGSGILAGKLASTLTTKATALAVAALLTAGVVGAGVVTKGRLEQRALRLQMAHKLVMPAQAVRQAEDDAKAEISEGLGEEREGVHGESEGSGGSSLEGSSEESGEGSGRGSYEGSDSHQDSGAGGSDINTDTSGGTDSDGLDGSPPDEGPPSDGRGD